MGAANREIEIKLRFESPQRAREAVGQLGATCIQPRLFEDNILYDRGHDPLEAAGKLLRLRSIGGRSLLTYKAPVPGTHRHKVREEHETFVDDAGALAQILAGLGFRPVYRYQKYRTLFELEQLHLCLDETPIGCFVELEGQPDAIDRVAARLGFGPGQFIRSTYFELHEEAAGVSRSELGDMLFDDVSGH